MPEQNPFIGRMDELSQIKDWINDWKEPHLLYIQGEGGLGKTRILQEIYSQFSKSSNSRLLFSPIFDFDDRTLRIPEQLEFEISQKIGQDMVRLYLSALHDLRKMELIEISQSVLAHQKEKVRVEFLNSLRQIAENQRVVLLFDTTDVFDEDEKKWAEIWIFLQELILNIDNLFVVFAGRNAKILWQSAQNSIQRNVHLIILVSAQMLSGCK